MPQEIINIQVGQAGNQVGSAFWETILGEHGLDFSGAYQGNDPQQLARVGVYFSAVEHGGQVRHVPRSVQLDLEAGVCNSVGTKTLAYCPSLIPEHLLR
ncbi:Tubulin beta-2 chain [Tulasnella sp. 419]|nr:Tubulin beta-2 chain [Tulasnella sp. 419]